MRLWYVLEEPAKGLFSEVHTRYVLSSTYSVPSVGIDPPTPVPSKKSAAQSHEKDGANADRSPNTDVRSNVRLKAGVRP